MKNAILSLIRHALTAVGAYAAGRGLLSETAVPDVVAGLLVIIGALWGAADEYKAENKKSPKLD